MNRTENKNWLDENQHYLVTALAELRAVLESNSACKPKAVKQEAQQVKIKKPLPSVAAQMFPPPALEALTNIFGLSQFERQILLLCAGMELDSSLTSLCATVQGDARRAYPTFSLALARLPEAYWSALSPAAPLRYWRLIELDNEAGLTQSPLRIDERILHYLTGVNYLDDRLAAFVEPIAQLEDLVPSHRILADELVSAWTQSLNKEILPVIQLCGEDQETMHAVAANACAKLGLNLHVMRAQSLPLEIHDLQNLMRLWEREAALSQSALLLDCAEMDATEPMRENAIDRYVEGLRSALIVSGRERRSISFRQILTFNIEKPTAYEQRKLWSGFLGDAAANLNGQLDILVSQFNVNHATVRAVCTEILQQVANQEKKDKEPSRDLGTRLWDICRVHSRPQLENLSQRIKTDATWDNLVLPEPSRQILKEVAIHVRQRMKVYETWGFAAKCSRGLGISALFSGGSGTGKTLAAEVLANELRLDLYRIDLSQVVSKYIGETEKNLRRVFDAAESCGAVLLFDEADALFGKRSEVKDSHDRYANIEISYLLQRMEAYHGLAILTTNMKSALDTAFLRRIRFLVQFPFPDAVQRAEIWRRIMPAIAPTEDLNIEKLARLNVTGGNIRNIALHAAFWAAELGEPVRMKHVLRAAKNEYAKMDKSLNEVEIRGWD